MKPAQATRITLLLAVIFAGGVVTGRMTVPKPPVLVPKADGRVGTSAIAMGRLKRHVNLSAEQERQFGELFEEIAVEMTRLPPASRERVEKLRSYRPRMEALLRPDQRTAFSNYVQEADARFERALRRRNAP